MTQGDPEGIGPELILQLAAGDVLRAGDVVIADPQRLAALSRTLRTPWAEDGWAALRGSVEGSPGLKQFDALARGVDRVIATPGSALVTAPIDKARV